MSVIEHEMVHVDGRTVACDGGGGALGHPRVWIAIPSSDRADCPYCGRTFLYQPGGLAGHEIEDKGPPGVKEGDPTANVDPEPQA